jgi:hypothetical protein
MVRSAVLAILLAAAVMFKARRVPIAQERTTSTPESARPQTYAPVTMPPRLPLPLPTWSPPPPTVAARAGVLAGTVFDSDGAPRAYASVSCTSEQNETLTEIADQYGGFAFKIETGMYQLRASAEDRITLEDVSIGLNPGESVDGVELHLTANIVFEFTPGNFF